MPMSCMANRMRRWTGFKPIAGIRQGPGHDHAHGVIEIRVAHLVIDINVLTIVPIFVLSMEFPKIVGIKRHEGPAAIDFVASQCRAFHERSIIPRDLSAQTYAAPTPRTRLAITPWPPNKVGLFTQVPKRTVQDTSALRPET